MTHSAATRAVPCGEELAERAAVEVGVVAVAPSTEAKPSGGVGGGGMAAAAVMELVVEAAEALGRASAVAWVAAVEMAAAMAAAVEVGAVEDWWRD